MRIALLLLMFLSSNLLAKDCGYCINNTTDAPLKATSSYASDLHKKLLTDPIVVEALCVNFVNENLFSATMKMYSTNIAEVAEIYDSIRCGQDKLTLMEYSDKVKDALNTAVDNYIKVADEGGLSESDRQWFLQQFSNTNIITYKELLEFFDV